MEREEISGLIENKYSDANQHFVTRVMCNNDITHYGYFNSFDDYTELKAKNQYRFIPRNNYLSLKSEYLKMNTGWIKLQCNHGEADVARHQCSAITAENPVTRRDA